MGKWSDHRRTVSRHMALTSVVEGTVTMLPKGGLNDLRYGMASASLSMATKWLVHGSYAQLDVRNLRVIPTDTGRDLRGMWDDEFGPVGQGSDNPASADRTGR